MITGVDVAMVAKVGSSVTKGVAAVLKQTPSGWPNLHEALMELYVIIDDWCAAAEVSNDAAHRSLNDRLDSIDPPRRHEAAPMRAVAMMNTDSNMFGGYVERTTGDLRGVRSPSTPWYLRWRRSQARAAARQTLRNMMRIYCAELLEQFDTAVAGRQEWVIENRRRFEGMLAAPDSDLEAFKKMVNEMDETLAHLQSVRVALHKLIRQNFPWEPAST